MVMMYCDGCEYVMGFQIVGEMFGMDGIGGGQYCCDVIVLEDSVVCIILFGVFEVVCCEMKLMQYFFYQMLSSEIVCELSQMLLFGMMLVEQCVVYFLLNLLLWFEVCGYLVIEFNLWMMCEEIGCYFGMKFEIVSWMFLWFYCEVFVEMCGKCVCIIDV